MKLTKELIEKINEELDGFYVKEGRVKKNNIEKQALTIIPKEGDSSVCPTVYADDCDSYEEVIEMIKAAAQVKTPDYDVEEIISRDYILSHLRACMISKDNVILEDEEVVYRPFLDMAIVYRVIMYHPANNQIGSILLRKDILEDAGIEESELYEIAKSNRDYQMKTLFQTIGDMTGVNYEEELSCQDGPDMYVVTSKDKLQGSSVLITDLIQELGKSISKECYVIPCSIHEIILIPYDERINAENLKQLVMQVNATEVSIEEKLTDSVYFLDKSGVSKIA
ncbi:MAG: hypothetical protein J6Y86_04500 [Pseudobutyrivibrio sp.]|nr:hypothetical protein [Pseudobutyrivibrio sp.]